MNYDGAPEWNENLYVYEGKPYGALPTPPARGEEFEFAGWYTERYGGSLISPTTVFSDGNQTVIYAHWSVWVEFADYYIFSEEPRRLKAQEGCELIIPDDIIDRFQEDGGTVLGWTTVMGSGENYAQGFVPNANRYTMPANIPADMITMTVDGVYVMALYALREGGTGGLFYDTIHLGDTLRDGAGEIGKLLLEAGNELLELLKRNPENVVDAFSRGMHADARAYFAELMSEPYYASENRKKENADKWTAIPEDTRKNYINGQSNSPWKDIRLGNSDVDDSGCGLIACYNALIGSNVNIYKDGKGLPELIQKAEERGYLLHIPVDEIMYAPQTTVLAALRALYGDNPVFDFLEATTIAQRLATRTMPFMGVGDLGLNPFYVSEILGDYGVRVESYGASDSDDNAGRTIASFCEVVKAAAKNGESRKFIVTYWLNSETGAHTVYFVTCSDGTIKVYNDTSRRISEKPFANYEAFEKDSLVDSNGKIMVIVGYEILK